MDLVLATEPRRYQRTALDAYDAARRAGRRRSCLVLPPGAGKTLVGLEIARREGRRTLVLAPNTAVQGQWAAQWSQHVRGTQPAGTDRSFDAHLTVLTYQALAVVDPDEADGRARTRVLRSGTPEELLGLLHPHARDAVARAGARGPWTLVLDEAHHLLELWGGLVRVLADALGEDTVVVGLTATPPGELSAWQRDLQAELFGAEPDFSVPTPAVVKEGDLAPYQELVYLTAPTPEEDTWVAAERSRFADLQVELASASLGSLPLFAWLERRLVDRRAEEGGVVSWQALEAAEPDLCRAALRFVHAGMLPLPAGARLREEHRTDPDADDWVELLVDFATRHLAGSEDPRDLEALAQVRRVLPSLGCRLAATGRRSAVSGVERLVSLSASKAAATAHLLEVEAAVLGSRLRAVVLCDREAASATLPSSLEDAPLGEQAGSALGMLEKLAAAAYDGVPGWLRPVLLTGRTVAARQPVADDLLAHCRDRHPGLRLETDDGGLCRLVGEGWTSRLWTPLVTSFFAQGQARVLVGTRALLGEGWDCPQVTTLVDCTEAGSGTSVVQMRGRSLRRDPADPLKLADNWTVTCVAAGHPRGDADYLRLVRKHAHHFAPAPDGSLVSGVGHCDPALSPYGPPDAALAREVTARSLARAADPDGARERWHLGEPYEGVETAVLRLRVERPLGVPAQLLPAKQRGLPRSRAPLGLAAAALLPAAAVAASFGHVAALAVLAGGAVLGIGETVRRVLDTARSLEEAGPSGALEQIAAAVADALHEAGDTGVGAEGVRLEVTADGWTQVRLSGGGTAASERFSTALDEVLAPLGEPRALVSRLVLPRPATTRGRLRLAARRTAGRPVEAAEAWHAVPAELGRNERRRRLFEAAWQHHVGPGRVVRTDREPALGVLALMRGADPFAVTSQTRTVWR
ncbi:MAG: hypothetical protein JWM64_2342 [Frankiales bacterium]|nr:hypothetical protein [Frankiales bacterium]